MSEIRNRNKADERRDSKGNGNESGSEDEEKNMVATIAAEEALAVPNELLAEEIFDAASDVLSPVVEELLGEGLVDVLGELGADSAIELVVGECLNNITGGLSGTFAGLTYSAYRSGVWMAPTARSGAALITGMIGGLAGSTTMRYVGGIVGGACGSVFEEEVGEEYGTMIGSTLFGAFGAFIGRLNGIRLSHKVYDTYFKKSKSKAKKQ